MRLKCMRWILILAVAACSSIEDPVPLPAPHLSVLFFSTGAQLSWDPVPGAAKGYHIVRENPDGSHLLYGDVFGTGAVVRGTYAVGQRFIVYANQDGVYPPNLATVTASHPLPGVSLKFAASSVHIVWDALGLGAGLIQRHADFVEAAAEANGMSSTGDFEDTTARPGAFYVSSVLTRTAPDYYRSDSVRDFLPQLPPSQFTVNRDGRGFRISWPQSNPPLGSEQSYSIRYTRPSA